MKKSLFLLGVSLLLSFNNFESFAQQTFPEGDLTIDIRPKRPTRPDINPLSLINDIEAYYSTGAVIIEFNVDLGDADIMVSNLSTGESWCDSVSGIGATTILLSEDKGYYVIIISTDRGDYTGLFII